MSITKRLLQAALVLTERRSTLANPSGWLVNWFRGGGDTYTGKTVNETTALNYTAVYAAVLILAETIGALPLELRRRTGNGFSDEARAHPLWELLHDAPNPEMDAMQFRQTLQGHVATWGNAFAHQVQDGGGRLRELWPLRPDWMTVERGKTGALEYHYRKTNGALRVFRRDEIFHLAGFGFDGLVGYSPITMARQAISVGLATEEFGGRFFSNGATAGGVLQHPGTLGEQAHTNLKNSFSEKQAGLENAHRPLILEEGMSWQTIGIPARDAQFLETRRFQLEEVARIYRIPLHLLQNLDRATFNNIQELGISFVQYTLLPWQVRWEKAIDSQLLTPAERRAGIFAKLRTQALLRGNTEQQTAAFVAGRQWGWLSPDDIRRLQDLPPLPEGAGGDIYLQPLNMAPGGTLPEAARAAAYMKPNGHAALEA